MTFHHNTTQIDLNNRRVKAMFGNQKTGERLSDPEYLRRLDPPPLESEESRDGK